MEALKDYYNHLHDDGVLWVARWRTHEKYYLENFRVLLARVVAALESCGVKNPEKHIVMLEEQPKLMWRQDILLVKKTPFRAEEPSAIEQLRQRQNLLCFEPGKEHKQYAE